MFEAMLLFLAAALCFLGMAWMSVALRSHWRQLYPRDASEPNSRLLRVLSCLVFLASAVCCLMADHASMAVLVWVLYLTAAAFIVSMVLARNPYWLRLFCPRCFSVTGPKQLD